MIHNIYAINICKNMLRGHISPEEMCRKLVDVDAQYNHWDAITDLIAAIRAKIPEFTPNQSKPL